MKTFKILTICIISGALAATVCIALSFEFLINVFFYIGMGIGILTAIAVAITLLFIGDNYEEINTAFKKRHHKKTSRKD